MRHIPAPLQNAGETVAEGAPPTTTGVERTGRIRTHEFEIDLDAGADLQSGVPIGALCHDLS